MESSLSKQDLYYKIIMLITQGKEMESNYVRETRKKRNAGLMDTLINFADLKHIGRKRKVDNQEILNVLFSYLNKSRRKQNNEKLRTLTNLPHLKSFGRKRNGGFLDWLLNFPDLKEIGKKRNSGFPSSILYHFFENERV